MGLDAMLLGRDSDIFQDEMGSRWDKIILAIAGQNPEAESFEVGEAGPNELSERIGPYGTLQLLRGYAAHIALEGCAPAKPWREEGNDPILERAYAEVKRMTRFRHLLDHSDCVGYYFPIQFKEPIWRIGSKRLFGLLGREEECSIGSCQRLLVELDEINQTLQVPGDYGQPNGLSDMAVFEKDPWGAEKWTWSVLHWLAREALERKLILVFT